MCPTPSGQQRVQTSISLVWVGLGIFLEGALCFAFIRFIYPWHGPNERVTF